MAIRLAPRGPAREKGAGLVAMKTKRLARADAIRTTRAGNGLENR